LPKVGFFIFFINKIYAYKYIHKEPDQVLRYKRWPEEDDKVAIWISSNGKLDRQKFPIPNCENCGSIRKFEMQLLPQFLSYFGTQSFIDFGTIVVYTCTKSCGESESHHAEFAFRQAST